MALEKEALFLKKAVHTGVLDADKGTAALYVYSQLVRMGAQFSFGQFLVERGLLSSMALQALEAYSGRKIKAVSQLGDFELIELIGEGLNGVVYRAVQLSLDRLVAVKVLNADVVANPESLQRFENEARATARLNHPNIVQGIDVGEDKGLHYFAMELVDGGSARTLLLSSGGKLDEHTALEITRQAAEGLKAAHAIGLMHRDLKPDNILLAPDGVAKLADLGISQPITARSGAGQSGGFFWASPPYVAPEIILGQSENNPASDIYSLGATLFELLTGRPPYTGATPEEILRAHIEAPVPDVLAFRPDVSVQTASLVKRMLAKNPAERVPNAATVVDAISRLLGLKVQAPTPPPSPAPVIIRPRVASAPATAGGGLRPGVLPPQPSGRPSGMYPSPARPPAAPPAKPAPKPPPPKPQAGPAAPRAGGLRPKLGSGRPKYRGR
ncbi:MAG: serine/threonine-protein kinase [Planctomycetota bacterium]|nr:serine/threonine-protein kinase [Planctomycetota bacterium]